MREKHQWPVTAVRGLVWAVCTRVHRCTTYLHEAGQRPIGFRVRLIAEFERHACVAPPTEMCGVNDASMSLHSTLSGRREQQESRIYKRGAHLEVPVDQVRTEVIAVLVHMT